LSHAWQNKGFKGTNKSSKRSISRLNRGKVEGSQHSIKSAGSEGSASLQASRAARTHKAKQSRDEQRKALVAARRGSGGVAPAPRVAVVFGCTRGADLASVKRMLLGKGADEMDETLPLGPVTAQVGQSQQRVTVIEGSRDLVALLDTLMVADIVVFVGQGTEDIDAKSMHLLHTAKLYGLPAPTLVVVQGVDAMPNAKRAQVLKTWEGGMTQATGREVKVIGQKPDDASVALRFLANTKIPARPSWQNRPLVLAERVERAADTEAGAGSEGEVVIGVSGYIRGSALNANQLVHIPSQGSYQVSKITVHSDPCPIGKGAASGMARDEDVFPDAPEELAMDNEVDDMDAEQTWPTEEELQGAKERVRAPKGAGEYQASWFRTIDDDDVEGGLDEEDEDDDEEDGESEVSEPPDEVVIDDDDDDDAMTEAGGETMVGGEEFLDR
jgi:pre-rRNA-processing protein TSR1